MVEEHWLLWGRPGEVEILKNTILLGYTILQGSFIKGKGREVA
jgi:hypothetical protein